jgi:retron-type reverse transcriptase
MYCAWELTRKDGAVGIDGVEAEEYERHLWENLQSLVDRLKSGTYRAPAVKRVYIPKAGSSTEKRPIVP